MTAMSLQSPWIAVAGVSLCIAAFWLARVRRINLPKVTVRLLFFAAVCLALAAGEPRWNRPRTGVVDVLVDLSPSTRTADYRQRDRLNARIAELLGTVKYRLKFFADGIAEPDLANATLADVPSEQTALPTSDADAVLLFSDAQFPLPQAGPPTYVAIDPALERPDDAAVSRLEIRGNEVVASLQNRGAPRSLAIIGANDARPTVAPTGSYAVEQTLRTDATVVTAQLSAADAWPENDALGAIPLPSATAERWWVGPSIAGGNWKSFGADALPTDAGAYLAPAVIVLENISASQLDDVRQQRLRQYAAELGGGIVIVGGNHAFGAGGYIGSVLETLSPLASAPPRPTMRWSLLVDGSGSMSAQSGRFAMDIGCRRDGRPAAASSA